MSRITPTPPDAECLTKAAYNYDDSEASADCVNQWMDWDEYCWSLSDEDYDKLCVPTEMDYIEAIIPEVLPNDDDSCMTPEAYNWSDDYCGNLWREFDEYCWEVALSSDEVYAEKCEPVN